MLTKKTCVMTHLPGPAIYVIVWPVFFVFLPLHIEKERFINTKKMKGNVMFVVMMI